MAKVNVNKATREELVEVAGLRPQVAEAILKMRDEQGGRIADLEALRELRGVGDATLDQLRDVLTFGTKVARQATEEAGETASEAVQAGATAAKAGAEAAEQTAGKVSDAAVSLAQSGAESARSAAGKGAEVTSLMARTGTDVTQRTMARLVETEKATAERSTAAASDLSQLVVGLINEQVQANVETLQALARARTWREALEIQNEFFRGNVERATQGASRYIETVSRLVGGLAETGKDEAQKAA